MRITVIYKGADKSPALRANLRSVIFWPSRLDTSPKAAHKMTPQPVSHIRHLCALGINGTTQNKKEGDGKTPIGIFSLRRIWYRPDRMATPKSPFAAIAISPEIGWSDDPSDPAYNQPITIPHTFNHERLWRDDGLYDIFFELGINDDPPRANLGSALFLHLEKNKYQPTQGCIAIAREAMAALVAIAQPGDDIEIKNG